MRVSGVAYAPGSAPAYAGGASTRAVAGPNSSYVEGVIRQPGGMPYDPADPRTCTETKKDGTRCAAFAVSGGTVCIGHRNRAEKQARNEEEAS